MNLAGGGSGGVDAVRKRGEEGLPVGLQLIGAPWSETRVPARERSGAGKAPLYDEGRAIMEQPDLTGRLRNRDRPRGARAASPRNRSLFSSSPNHFGDAPNRNINPGLHGAARYAAGAQPSVRSSSGSARALAPDLRDQGACAVSPQELLLPGSAEGLPDLAVRYADLPRRGARRVRIHRVDLEEDAAKLIHVGRAAGSTGRIAAGSTSTAAARRWSRS